MSCADDVSLHLSNLGFKIIMKNLSSPSNVYASISLGFEKQAKDVVLQIPHGLKPYSLELVELDFNTRSYVFHYTNEILHALWKS